MRLTGPNVSRLVLPEGKTDLIIFDDTLAGFGIRLRAGGKRVWIAQYRVGTKQRRLTIGSVDKISADLARSHAKDLLAKVQLGADPQIEKVSTRAKAAVTLGAVADQYVEDHARKRLKPRSFAEVDRHFRLHWKALRELQMDQVSRADIARQLKTIAAENGPFAANRARASLSAMFGWAMREGLVEANPVVGTNKAADEVSRDRVLSDEELALILDACNDDDYGRIVRLLILTGQRREEVGGMMWPEIETKDPAKALWVLPRARTKNGLAHEVPLSASAIAIIGEIPRRKDRDLVFGEGKGAFQGWSRAKAKMDERIAAARAECAKTAGEKPKPMEPWRLHDIRRTVATRLGDLGVLPHVVEAILNHVSGHRAGVAGIYNRATYSFEKREALNVWSKELENLTAKGAR